MALAKWHRRECRDCCEAAVRRVERWLTVIFKMGDYRDKNCDIRKISVRSNKVSSIC